MTIPPNSWNSRFIEACTFRKTSPKEVALAIGVSAPAARMWETGDTKELTLENGLKACAFLGIRPEWLRFGTGPMSASEGGADYAISKSVLTEKSHVSNDPNLITIENIYKNSGAAQQAALAKVAKALFLMGPSDIDGFCEIATACATMGLGKVAVLASGEDSLLKKWRSSTSREKGLAIDALSISDSLPPSGNTTKRQ